MSTRFIFIAAALLAFSLAGAPAARAQMSCHDFLHGMALDEVATAKLAAPTLLPILTGSNGVAVLLFVEQECRRVPDATVQEIVGLGLRAGVAQTAR